MKVTRTVRYLSVRYGPELLLFVPVPYPVLVEPRVPPSSIEHGGLESRLVMQNTPRRMHLCSWALGSV